MQYCLIGNSFRKDQFIEVDERGKIISISNSRKDEDAEVIKLNGIVLPGLVNSHSHAFQVLLRGSIDKPMNFSDWVDSALYPLVEQLSDHSLEIATTVAYCQMIQNGITTVGEFHYIHNQLDGSYEGDELTQVVIEAAKSVGIRQRLLYCGYDKGSKLGQKRFKREVNEVLNSVNNLRSRYHNDELIHIGVAPHSLHGASEEMIDALMKWSIENNEPIHIHIAEQQSDLDLAKKLYNRSPLEFLNSKKLFNSNLSLVHGIWVKEDELQYMKDGRSHHVYNPLTNMALGDGIAPMDLYLSNEIPSAIGTDANNDLNILQELRTVEWLQRVSKLEMGILKPPQGSFGDISQLLFDMVTRNGGKSLMLPIGELKEGNYADFIVITTDTFSIRKKGNILDQIINSLNIVEVLDAVYIGGELIYTSSNGFTRINVDDLLDKFNNI